MRKLAASALGLVASAALLLGVGAASTNQAIDTNWPCHGCVIAHR